MHRPFQACLSNVIYHYLSSDKSRNINLLQLLFRRYYDNLSLTLTLYSCTYYQIKIHEDTPAVFKFVIQVIFIRFKWIIKIQLWSFEDQGLHVEHHNTRRIWIDIVPVNNKKKVLYPFIRKQIMLFVAVFFCFF